MKKIKPILQILAIGTLFTLSTFAASKLGYSNVLTMLLCILITQKLIE